MSRIFLDVGANTGQTLAAVMEPEFRFDVIHSFEPASLCWKKLAATAGKDPRVHLWCCGLWNKTGHYPLIEPGRKGASMWKKEKSTRNDTEMCRVERASEFFKTYIAAGNEVFLKLNCEGAECDILDDLLDSGEFDKVTYAMIDFDVRKIAKMKHREAEVRARLEPYGFPRIAFARDVMVGETHADRIQNWLRLVEAANEI